MKEITMPKLSDTMTEGTVVSWRKDKGAQVTRGDIIAEVETDKATMELEAFASGVLLEIRVKPGETVPVGTVIGLIGDEGEEPRSGKDSDQEAATEEPEVEQQAEEKPAPQEPEETETSSEKPEKTETQTDRTTRADEVLAAPIVRRRAQELGIDLAEVRGSGPKGQVLLEDLDIPAVEGIPADSVEESKADKAPEDKPSRAMAEMVQTISEDQGEPLSRMRTAIAKTVVDSWRSIPHFSVTVEVRMDAAERLRGRIKKDGRNVSITALLIMASAQALTKFPRLNASLKEERLITHDQVNVGLVTRRDEGLLVPVLRNCARLPLADIAERTALLVERARQGQLSDTEMSSGTFAISNMGMYDVHSFVALILPPMAAALAVGAVRDGVVAEAGQPVVARLMSMTLSADHRIVDGVYVAQFLQELKVLLEEPQWMAG